MLIVDDEAAHLKALCSTLQLDGFETTGFQSPREALAHLIPGRYELLLTDLLMPGMDGIELLQAARAIDPDLAGIVMTGHGTIDTAVAALQKGAADYIQKPFKLSALLPVLGRALEGRRLRLENAALQERERQRTAELAAAYQDLEAFAHSVSHDLRAPLRAVEGYCNIYVDDYGADLAPRARELIDHVVAGAQRMDRLIEALLRFSRYGSQPLRPERVRLDPLVRRVVAEASPGDADIHIGELPDVTADPVLLEQVLVNLVSNALKFSRHRRPARVEIGSKPGSAGRGEPAEHEFFVRDNGAGFDPAYADRLFGVFQRLHPEKEFEGTGVGLSIAQRIVQRHGGRIWATSTPGDGASFHFTLPSRP